MNISEPGWHTNEQGVDDSDDDTDSDVKNNTDWVSSMVLMNTQWGVYWNCQYIYAYSSIRNVLKYSIIDFKNTGFMFELSSLQRRALTIMSTTGIVLMIVITPRHGTHKHKNKLYFRSRQPVHLVHDDFEYKKA